jgi:hypothetical protein
MTPLYFVGIPDWRSAILAALFTLPWLYLLARNRLRQWPLWVGLALTAVLFPFAIAWVQVPLQGLLSLFWLRLIGMEAIQRYVLLVSLPSLVVASLVQEALKLLGAVLAPRLLRVQRDSQAGVAAGAAAGAGLGGFEAFWVLNTIFAAGWTWGTVQLAGLSGLIGFIERFFAVPFHVAASAVTGYGYAAGRPWRCLLLAIVLHSAVNYSSILLQAGLASMAGLEVWVAVLATATVGLAFWLRRRTVRPAAKEGVE